MPLLSQPARIIAAAIWTLVATVIAVALVVRLPSGAGADRDPTEWYQVAAVAALIASFTTVGALLAEKRPDHLIGWLLMAVGISFTVFVVAEVALDEPRVSSGSAALVLPLVVLGNLGLGVGLALAGPLLLTTFPDGRLPSPAWRPLVWIVALAIGSGILAVIIKPGNLEGLPGTPNPAGIPGPLSGALNWVSNVLFTAAFMAGVAALIIRARRADAITRQQLKWFGYVGALSVASFLLGVPLQASIGDIGFFVGLAGLSLLPVAIGLAVARYRLYEIDTLISRTLVYVPLTGILGGVYAASITLFQRLFIALTGESSDAAVVITTLILAGTFTPVRKALEAVVERRYKPEPARTPDDIEQGTAAIQPSTPEAWESQVERIAERVAKRVLAERTAAPRTAAAPERSAQPEGDHDSVAGGDDRR